MGLFDSIGSAISSAVSAVSSAVSSAAKSISSGFSGGSSSSSNRSSSSSSTSSSSSSSTSSSSSRSSSGSSGSTLSKNSSSGSATLTQYSQGKAGDKASMTVITSNGQQIGIAGGKDIGSYITDDGILKTQEYYKAKGEEEKLAAGYEYYGGNLYSPAQMSAIRSSGGYDASKYEGSVKKYSMDNVIAKQTAYSGSPSAMKEVKQVYNNSTVIQTAQPGTLMMTTMSGDAYYRPDASSEIYAGGSDFKEYLTTAGLPVSTYKVSAAVAESRGLYDTIEPVVVDPSFVPPGEKGVTNTVMVAASNNAQSILSNAETDAKKNLIPTPLQQKLQDFRESGGLSTMTVLSSGGNNTYTTGTSGGVAATSNTDSQPSSATALSAAQTIIADAMQPAVDNAFSRAQNEGVVGIVEGAREIRDASLTAGFANAYSGFQSGDIGQMAAGVAQGGVTMAVDTLLPLDAIHAATKIASGGLDEMTTDEWITAGIDVVAAVAGIFTAGSGYLAIKGAKAAAKTAKNIGIAGHGVSLGASVTNSVTPGGDDG